MKRLKHLLNKTYRMNSFSLDKIRGLPDQLDLKAVSKVLQDQNNTSAGVQRHQAFVTSKPHTISDQKFGSLWNFKQHGIVLCNTFCNYPGPMGIDHTVSAEGPAIRILGFSPGLLKSDRANSTKRNSVNMFDKRAESSLVNIDKIIVAENCARYRPKKLYVDDWHLFRLRPAQYEKDDDKLIDKMLEFNKFVMNYRNAQFMDAVQKMQDRPVERLPDLPMFLSDVAIPPRQNESGEVMPQLTQEEIDQVPPEYVPPRARGVLKYVVIGIICTPTLLNCTDESEYLHEYVEASPLGKKQYDEAIAVQVFRPFTNENDAKEFKENFAKHTMPHCRIYVVPLYERLPLLEIFTQWHEETVPMSYHDMDMHEGVVDRPEQERVKRELAESQGMEIIHIGPEQTKEEGQAELDKIKNVGLAKQRVAEMEEKLRMFYIKRNASQTQEENNNDNDDGNGGGGTKE